MKKNIIIFCIALISTTAWGQDASGLDGKVLFRNHCKACHNVDKKLVGPALKDLETRRDSAWIYDFIKASQSMIAQGDETAISLFQEFSQVIMPDQTVNNNEIAAILDYIEEAGKADPAAANPIKRPEVAPIEYANHFRFSNYTFWIPFTISVILFMAFLYKLTEYSDLVDEYVGDES